MLYHDLIYNLLFQCVICRIKVDSEQADSSSQLSSGDLSVISETSEESTETNDDKNDTNTVQIFKFFVWYFRDYFLFNISFLSDEKL